MRYLLLASQGLAALPVFLAGAGAGPAAVFVPTAANGLGGDAVVDGYRALLVRLGLDVRDLDLDEPEPGQPLAGLGLTDVLVLPHDDRLGRAERNAAAVRAHPEVRTIPLADDEAITVHGDRAEPIPSAVV